ncbi:hypothetical protein F2Q68_00018075 [Brassica cretica]|uniref:Uncharacterized protein n=1 Tax=Brassica cretica TaxID=69181 RepID=A0A8S9HHT3_BRACR|nr:hypothetical protein F2Q68_00018075 [Brassica cretica]
MIEQRSRAQERLLSLSGKAHRDAAQHYLNHSSEPLLKSHVEWFGHQFAKVGSAVQRGVFGCSGYIRIWDPRSRAIVWETSEPGSGRSSRFGDALADVDVDVEESTLFKVCSKSGDLGMADLRKLGEDPWVYVSDDNPGAWSADDGERSGGYSVVHCYRKQVLAARGGALEVWSSVEGKTSGGLIRRRNFVDKEEDSKRGMVSKIEAGGDRLFVSREYMEGVEENVLFLGRTVEHTVMKNRKIQTSLLSHSPGFTEFFSL